MTVYTADEVRELCGDIVPIIKNAVPAAWWITTDPEQIAAHDSFKRDYDAYTVRVEALAQSLGLTTEHARITSWGQRTDMTGFRPKREWTYWSGHSEFEPIPEGWRLDKKKDLIVPSRKTKADRESQANKDFAAVRRCPDINAYLTGIPSEIHLHDRDFGGTIYRTQYRIGERCLMAFSGGDPDRDPDQNLAIDESIWHRQKISVLLELNGR